MTSLKRSRLPSLLAVAVIIVAFGLACMSSSVAFAESKTRKPSAERKRAAPKKTKKSVKKTADQNQKTSLKTNVDSKKLARPGQKDESPTAVGTKSGKETAFRSIGILVFAEGNSVPDGFAGEGAVRFCEEFSRDLNRKSYFRGTCLKQRQLKSETGQAVVELADRRGVDALLFGSVSKAGVTMRLISGRSGRVIGTFKSEAAPKFDDSGREKMVHAAVDAFVARIPFRGFVARVVPDEIEVNLGSAHGMVPGTMLKAFEFVGSDPTMDSGQSAKGVIEVTEILGPDLLVGRLVDSRGTIQEYTKIAIADAEPPRTIATTRVVQDAFWISAGPEILTIDSEIKGVQNLNRQYKMNSTPFLQLGVGQERWFANVWYGYASDDEETLSYFSLLAAYQVKTVGGFKSGYAVSAGAWISQYSASIKRRSLTQVLDSSTRYSPYLELRYQRVFGTRFALFASIEGQYPLFSSGQQSGQIPFSYGFGSTPGARFIISEGLSLEAGYRYQFLKLPLAGDKGTTETHSGYFLRAVFPL